MPRRTILTDRQRSALFDLPVDEPSLRKHYTLADDDLQHIGQRRRGENRLGFALQLCALRHPGRALQPGELIPSAVVEFIGAQLGVAVEALLPYAARRQTRQEHMAALRSIYGYRAFAGRGARHLKDWLDGQAEEARSKAELARRLVEECRRRQIILPAVSTLERLCANAAVAADRSVEERIADRLDAAARTALDGLLSETLETRVTRFVWLRQFEPGNNAAVAGRLLDRGEFLQRLGLSERIIEDLPSHRVTRLRRQGAGAIPGGVIRDGGLNIDRLAADPPEGADELILDLYKRIPDTRITDILMDVDDAIGFTDAFVHLRTGAPCKDKIGLLNVLLAEGVNLSIGKMAESTNTHDYWELMRRSRWQVDGEAIDRALAMVIEAQAKLPLAAFWGLGTTASSDGQFFPTTRQGEAMNLVNAKYGSEPGLKAYTHVSDRFGPFATQIIPATVNEAPYILDGLLMNETGRHIREQYADTGGFTDHVFAVTSILGYRFVPRIRDLPSKRIYVFEPGRLPEGTAGSDRRQAPPIVDRLELARHPAAGGNPGRRHGRPQPDPAQAGRLPTPQRPRRGAARNRPHRAHALHDRLGAGPGHATPCPDRSQQGRIPPRPEERLAHRPSGRNQGSQHGRPALPHGRPQPACRHRHLLEHRPAGRSGR